MAYFLDPELDALTTGKSRQPVRSPRTDPGQNRRANKFGKKCQSCDTWVKAGAGYLGQLNGAWVVYCSTCP